MADQLDTSFRSRLSTIEAGRFVESQAALPSEPQLLFSPYSRHFVPEAEISQEQIERAEIWKQADEDKERLFELMEEVQRKLSKNTGDDEQVKGVLNLRQCSWSQVWVEIEQTARRWRARPEKQGKTMVFIDKVGTYSQAMQAWLELLPGGDYGSSICGVFKLAIGAAGQYNKVEEDIFEALSEIPDIMETSRRYVDMYRKRCGHRLEQRIVNFFRASLSSLRHIMQFFADSRYRKFFGAVTKQTAYKIELANSLAEMRKCATAIQTEALLCHAEESHETLENSESSAKVLDRLVSLLETSPLLHVLSSNLDLMLPRDTTEDELQARSAVRLRQQQIEAAEAARESQQRLLQHLRYEPEALARDVSSCIQLGYQLDDRAKARAASMIRQDMFKSFMQNAECSTSLLVNGREDVSAADGISPLSLVAAELTRLSEVAGAKSSPVFVVSYFCAAHQSSPIANPATSFESSAVGMMASLAGQLLLQMTNKGVTTDLSFLTEKKWKKIDRLDVATLCTMFKKLARQLPAGGVLLCIVDEISLYETQVLQDATDFVMQSLAHSVNTQRSDRAVIKLLVTCRDRALRTARHFEGHTLDLEEAVDCDDSADWIISTIAG